jgi:hypothetical protein
MRTSVGLIPCAIEIPALQNDQSVVCATDSSTERSTICP